MRADLPISAPRAVAEMSCMQVAAHPKFLLKKPTINDLRSFATNASIMLDVGS
jgi:hypothetical protein